MLTLKNLIISKSQSEETTAFTATLLWNDHKVGDASNSGKGGNTNVYFTNKLDGDMVRDWAEAQPLFFHGKHSDAIEQVIDDLIIVETLKKGILADCRKGVVVHDRSCQPGEYRIFKAKGVTTPTAEGIAQVKAKVGADLLFVVNEQPHTALRAELINHEQKTEAMLGYGRHLASVPAPLTFHSVPEELPKHITAILLEGLQKAGSYDPAVVVPAIESLLTDGSHVYLPAFLAWNFGLQMKFGFETLPGVWKSWRSSLPETTTLPTTFGNTAGFSLPATKLTTADKVALDVARNLVTKGAPTAELQQRANAIVVAHDTPATNPGLDKLKAAIAGQKPAAPAEAPAKRGPGRPKKVAATPAPEATGKGKPGRPKKAGAVTTPLLPVAAPIAPSDAPTEAPAPTRAPRPTAPAESALSSTANPLNKKLWEKRLAIDGILDDFDAEKVSPGEAIGALAALAFGIQCYHKVVARYRDAAVVYVTPAQ